jgi:glutathione S-transferase
MSLTLYFHPLSSFCQKVLIALYENGTPFTPRIINLGDPAERAELAALWPITKFPVLRDAARGRTVPESSVIIEYLDQHYPGETRFVPADPDLARQMRLSDRFFDLYVNVPMQKIVTDKLRPPGQSDAFGVEQAKALLSTSLAMLDKDMAGKTWAMGEAFTMADCAAAPPLFYANEVLPFEASHPHAWRYFSRLKERPSYARALAEMQPYWAMFPR